VLLEGKNAVIYGGGGSIGRAVARGFAREGAKIHLAGRTAEPLADVAEEIEGMGAAVETAQLDALDEEKVAEHADAVVGGSGSLDISINLISLGEVFGTPLAEMPLADFERPVMFGGYGVPISDFYFGGSSCSRCSMMRPRRGCPAGAAHPPGGSMAGRGPALRHPLRALRRPSVRLVRLNTERVERLLGGSVRAPQHADAVYEDVRAADIASDGEQRLGG
jgi:hypothetical protein